MDAPRPGNLAQSALGILPVVLMASRLLWPMMMVPRAQQQDPRLGMSMKGVNDGDGDAFIDHVGNVCPSGFLPLPAGNLLHEQSLACIYRDSPLFRANNDIG